MKAIAPLIAALFVCATGPLMAQTMSMPMMRAPAPASTTAAIPFVNGEVRRLDQVTGVIVLRHDEIPNLSMPAMTMGYAIAYRKMLAGFKVGDRVHFRAEMVNGTATVTALQPLR